MKHGKIICIGRRTSGSTIWVGARQSPPLYPTSFIIFSHHARTSSSVHFLFYPSSTTTSTTFSIFQFHSLCRLIDFKHINPFKPPNYSGVNNLKCCFHRSQGKRRSTFWSSDGVPPFHPCRGCENRSCVHGPNSRRGFFVSVPQEQTHLTYHCTSFRKLSCPGAENGQRALWSSLWSNHYCEQWNRLQIPWRYPHNIPPAIQFQALPDPQHPVLFLSVFSSPSSRYPDEDGCEQDCNIDGYK